MYPTFGSPVPLSLFPTPPHISIPQMSSYHFHQSIPYFLLICLVFSSLTSSRPLEKIGRKREQRPCWNCVFRDKYSVAYIPSMKLKCIMVFRKRDHSKNIFIQRKRQLCCYDKTMVTRVQQWWYVVEDCQTEVQEFWQKPVGPVSTVIPM